MSKRKQDEVLRSKHLKNYTTKSGVVRAGGWVFGDNDGPYDDTFWGAPEQEPSHRELLGLSDRVRGVDSIRFESFVGEVRNLFNKSEGKGYGPSTPDDPNPLYEFMRGFFSDDHALGEIVYKAIRYKNKRNPEDLVKIAGWAWLIFMHHWQEEAERG